MEKEYQKAINYLTNLINTRQISEGDKLPAERTIASQLDISRNSTREALRSLENMGITESRQGSGNYLTADISKPLSSMIKMMMMLEKFSKEEICDFRKAMEKMVCFFIIENHTFTDEFSAQADELLGKMYSSDSERATADRNFHYLLIKATGNRLIISIMSAITDIYREWIDDVIENADDKTKDNFHKAHIAMIDSIRKGNKAECEKAIETHYLLF